MMAVPARLFTDIVAIVEQVLQQIGEQGQPSSLEDVFALDQAMRDVARSCIVSGNQSVRKVS